MMEYVCHTRQGHWRFEASTPQDAMRCALYYCWRDGEDFVKVVGTEGGRQYTLRLCRIDSTNAIQTI